MADNIVFDLERCQQKYLLIRLFKEELVKHWLFALKTSPIMEGVDIYENIMVYLSEIY